jgi:hypothetical protein
MTEESGDETTRIYKIGAGMMNCPAEFVSKEKKEKKARRDHMGEETMFREWRKLRWRKPNTIVGGGITQRVPIQANCEPDPGS